MQGSAKPARLVSYYRSVKPTRHKVKDTTNKEKQWAYMQHMRQFKQQGRLNLDLRTNADRCLIEDLKEWKQKGEEIILVGDFDQRIYKSKFARALTGSGLNLREQYRSLCNKEAPFSHMTGHLPIIGCFACIGIELNAYSLSNHQVHGSVGSHRLHVIDFASDSILGKDLPILTKRSG